MNAAIRPGARRRAGRGHARAADEARPAEVRGGLTIGFGHFAVDRVSAGRFNDAACG